MDSRDFLILGAVALALWWLFGRRKRACCAGCAGAGAGAAMAARTSGTTGMSAEDKARARGCGPFACAR